MLIIELCLNDILWVRGVTLGYYIQDPKKLFELLLDIRDFSNL